MLKVELHAHTSLDPVDGVRHSTSALIDHAASLGYDALAITCHDRYYDPADDLAHAATRGMLLLSGIERTIDGAHVLLINFPRECAAVVSFAEIRALRQAHPNGLVIAPHPLFPNPTAMGLAVLERHQDVFDAIEVSAMYTRLVDFNTRAVAWARSRDKPLVGNSDIHTLAQLGTTYTLVDAPKEANALCEAVRRGRVQVKTAPLSSARAARLFSAMLMTGVRGFLRRRWPRHQAKEAQT